VKPVKRQEKEVPKKIQIERDNLYKPYDAEKVVDTRNKLNNIYSDRGKLEQSHYSHRGSEHIEPSQYAQTSERKANINIQDDNSRQYVERPHSDLQATKFINKDNNSKVVRPQSQREIQRENHALSPVPHLEYDEKRVREIINKYSHNTTNRTQETNGVTSTRPGSQINSANQRREEPIQGRPQNVPSGNSQRNEERKVYSPQYDLNRQNNRSAQDNNFDFHQLDQFSPPGGININYQSQRPREENQNFKRKEDLGALKNYSNNLTYGGGEQHRERPYTQMDNRIANTGQFNRPEEQYKLDSNSKNFVLEKLNRLGSTLDRRTPI
jgi:hypothetical protein